MHHPRGRAYAGLVGVTVPAFYASVTPPAIEVAAVRAHVTSPVWIAPTLTYEASTRPVWVEVPAPSWNAKLSAHAEGPRGGVAWYVRPPELHAHAIVGIPATAQFTSGLTFAAPQPRASLRAAWAVPVGVHVKIGMPDVSAGMQARAHYRVGVAVPDVAAGVRTEVHVPAVAAGVRTEVHVPDVAGGVRAHVRVPVVQAGVHVRAGAAAVGDAAAQAEGAVRAGVKVRVAVPTVKVKVKVPSVKVRAGAGFSVH